jgi:methanethiol S-methyltransferase
MEYFLLAIMLIGYCALHSYLISIRFTHLMNRLLKKYYSFYRLFYVLISIVLLIPIINYKIQIGDNIIVNYGFYLNIFRQFLTVSSILIIFWAFFVDYDALSFFGIRQILRIGYMKNINSTKELKRKGLLGLMRHPMYFAAIVYLWSQTHRLSDLIVNTIITIYIVIGTILEENKLIIEFGDAYLKYQKEVPMLFPFTKASK